MLHYHLSDIYIYPIKSLGPIRLHNTETTKKGLQFDRRWMLVNDNNVFMTIRKYTEFLFFELSRLENGFRVSYKGQTLDIPTELTAGELISANVWDDETEVIKAGDLYNDWFSKALGVKCSLVYMPDASSRRIKPEWGAQEVNLADGYPLLVVGKASLLDLNGKLEKPAEMLRFRPNLVFEGGKAYDEYLWGEFTVGNIKFQGLKPCARCIVTTYDLNTGEKGREPLLTLSKQKIEDKIVFGQHANTMGSGRIAVGDEIEVNVHKPTPYAPIDLAKH